MLLCADDCGAREGVQDEQPHHQKLQIAPRCIHSDCAENCPARNYFDSVVYSVGSVCRLGVHSIHGLGCQHTFPGPAHASCWLRRIIIQYSLALQYKRPTYGKISISCGEQMRTQNDAADHVQMNMHQWSFDRQMSYIFQHMISFSCAAFVPRHIRHECLPNRVVPVCHCHSIWFKVTDWRTCKAGKT